GQWIFKILLSFGSPFTPVQSRKSLEKLCLSCKGSAYTFSSYNTRWIRQPKPGKALEWIGGINSGSTNIELTKDSSVIMTYLKLSGLKSEDSAVYYCARWVQWCECVVELHKNNTCSRLWNMYTHTTLTLLCKQQGLTTLYFNMRCPKPQKHCLCFMNRL
uniref:Ig-like domain-containing protein n=1 Tax=Salmo trutta TaxID=8032 RepID=A0A674EHY5_SALTR